MPGLFTNYLFGKDVYSYTYDENIIRTLTVARKPFELGLQGPDIFLYDNKRSDYAKLIHNNNTYEFILNLLKTASGLREESKNIALAYTYGFISHFALDTHTNPYIIYMSGFKVEDSDDEDFFAMSTSAFEHAIDKVMIQKKRGLTIDQLRRQDLIGLSDKELAIICNLLSRAIKNTFSIEISPRNVCNVYNTYKLSNILLQSNKLNPSSLLHNLESYMLRSSTVRGIIGNKNIFLPADPVNDNNYGWNYPWTEKNTYYDSFMDLYENAISYASRLINEADSIVNFNTKPYTLKSLIDDKSYITGVDCKKILSMKYFRNKEKESQ